MAEKKIEKKAAPAAKPAAVKAPAVAAKPAVKTAAKPAAAKPAVKAAAPKAAAPAAKPAAAKAAAPKATAPAAKAPAKASSGVLKAIEFKCYSPASGVVEVAGDFNEWQPSACPMKKDAHGYWSAKIKLAAGRYMYKFVFDGSSWELDPNAPAVGTDIGLNNLLEIK